MFSKWLEVIVKRFMSDEEFRDRLKRDPEGALAAFSLSKEERYAVAAVLVGGGVSLIAGPLGPWS